MFMFVKKDEKDGYYTSQARVRYSQLAEKAISNL